MHRQLHSRSTPTPARIRQASPARRQRAAPTVARVLELQRGIGNHATARALAGRRPLVGRAALQRAILVESRATPDHPSVKEMLAEAEAAKSRGLRVTDAAIAALTAQIENADVGRFYLTWDDAFKENENAPPPRLPSGKEKEKEKEKEREYEPTTTITSSSSKEKEKEKEKESERAESRAGTTSRPVVKRVLIQQGLIHGTYICFPAGTAAGGRDTPDNTADLHVEAARGKSLTAADMLVVARHVQSLIAARETEGGPPGRIMLHPTGAVVVKKVIELLGEALGGMFGRLRANWAKKRRAKVTTGRQSPKLDASVLPEHFAYLDALTDVKGLDVQARFKSVTERYAPTSDVDAFASIVSSKEGGPARRKQYEGQVSDPAEREGAGLDVTIDAAHLPAVIIVLQQAAELEAAAQKKAAAKEAASNK